jgi:hypothetical protein
MLSSSSAYPAACSWSASFPPSHQGRSLTVSRRDGQPPAPSSCIPVTVLPLVPYAVLVHDCRILPCAGTDGAVRLLKSVSCDRVSRGSVRKREARHIWYRPSEGRSSPADHPMLPRVVLMESYGHLAYLETTKSKRPRSAGV